MSFIFTMRSAQSGNSMHRRDPVSVTSLPRIEEDNTVSWNPPLPPIPQRSRNRPHKDFPFNLEHSPPPPYLYDADGVKGPKGEKLADIRRGIANNKQIAKRGGLKKLCLIAWILIACIVGLVVGLVVGLRKHDETKSATATGSGSNSPTTGGGSGNAPATAPVNPATSTVFPAGSYTLDTYLDESVSNCTSNAATWMCYPGSTYRQDRLSSNATFQWVINPDPKGKGYLISSTPNPFAPQFTNISLTMGKGGQPDEHYYFQTLLDKMTKPTTPLGSQNLAATCTFSQTTFQGYLYTKMGKTFPSNSTTVVNTATPYAPWPYAIKIEQIASSGTGTPSCVGPSGQSLGDFSNSDGGNLCDCLWLNTGT